MRRRGLVTLALVAAALAGCSSAGPAPDDVAAAVGPAVEEHVTAVDPDEKVRAVLVRHGGEPVVDRYTGTTADDYWDTMSVTKSVVSTLVGIAIADGHIEGVDQTLGDLLPSRASEMSEETAAVTLHELLTHTGGFAGEEGALGSEYFFAEDWVGQILADRNEAGATDGSFVYSNAGAHVVSAVLVDATGLPVLDYARQELFDPMGIPSEPASEPLIDLTSEATFAEGYQRYRESDFTWPVDPQGVHEGACCLKLRAQDLAALGQLYLDQGRWGDEQVVPADWVEQATTAHVELTQAGTSGYGYLWWTTDTGDEPAFLAYGSGGQVIQVVPGHELVVAVQTDFDLLDPARLSTQLGLESATNMVELAIVPHLGG